MLGLFDVPMIHVGYSVFSSVGFVCGAGRITNCAKLLVYGYDCNKLGFG